MKRFVENIIYVLAFAVAAVAVRYGLDEYKQYKLESGANEALTKLESSVASDTSDKTYSEKLAEASQKLVSKELDRTASNKDLSFPAGVFSGQYGRAVFATVKYCNTLGVDVSEYAETYKKMHEDIYLRVESILRTNGASIEKIYKSIEPSLNVFVEKEISDIRDAFLKETEIRPFTLADACEYFNILSRNPELMKEVMFSNTYPDAYAILME